MIGWWNALDPADRITYRANAALFIGGTIITPALGFLLVGLVYCLTLFGFKRR